MGSGTSISGTNVSSATVSVYVRVSGMGIEAGTEVVFDSNIRILSDRDPGSRTSTFPSSCGR